MTSNIKLSEKIFLKNIMMNYPDSDDVLHVMLSTAKVEKRKYDTYGAYIYFSEIIDGPGLRSAGYSRNDYFTCDYFFEELNITIMFILYLNNKKDAFSFLEITLTDSIERDFFRKKYPDMKIKDKGYLLTFLDFLSFDEIEYWVASCLLDVIKFELV